MRKFLIFFYIIIPLLITTTSVLADEWKVIRSEKIYANVEVKTEVGREYVCKEVTNNDDAFAKAIILAIAGSMIDSEHAFLGAISGLMLGDVQVRKVCYDEIVYDTKIEKKYMYTLVTLSNGSVETTQKIYE
tara:strand:- start:2983 stop:3378 length:396 start_codon:yes stop_codon:yes gene_type:complete